VATPSPRALTWLLISRAAALVIVFTLLGAFLVVTILELPALDKTVLLAFLSIASGLLFGPPAGYYLIVRRRNGNGSQSE